MRRTLKLKFFIYFFSSYLITVPATFRPGMAVNMNILILRAKPPDAAVTVNATFLIDSKRITTASGQFYAGLQSALILQRLELWFNIVGYLLYLLIVNGQWLILRIVNIVNNLNLDISINYQLS